MNNQIFKVDKKDHVWIKGYEDLYSISKDGLVYSHPRLAKHYKGGYRLVKGRYMSTNKSRGYIYVSLNKDGIQTRFALHTLLGNAYIDNPNNYPVINHIDENPSNFKLDNLEWCTQQYNSEYSNSMYWKVTFPNKYTEKIFNLSKFCRENDLDCAAMHRVSKGKNTHHKQYKCEIYIYK